VDEYFLDSRVMAHKQNIMTHKENITGDMDDSEIYRLYSQECQRLAKTMPEEHRETLLRLAEAWIKVAEETQRR
jgi:hypothetical protein